MRTFLLAAAVSFAVAPAIAQNPYTRNGVNISSIADRRARNVGDILTITVQEQTSIKNEDKVERKNSTSLAARLDAFTLASKAFDNNALPKVDLSKDSSFNGEAKQNSGSDVRASIAVIVIDVLPNGNLVVAGTRSVTVNDETRTLRISGIVRPLDISSANTIGSAQVADARIAITGEGGNTRQITRGPVGKLFDVLVWAAWPF